MATKYRSVRSGAYASKAELKRSLQLKMLERAGKIRNLREQVKFVLLPKQDGERECSYIADFCFEELGPISGVWVEVVGDVKGYRTPVYRLKKKLMLFIHGIKIREM